MKDVLSEWEAKAKQTIRMAVNLRSGGTTLCDQNEDRILALIDLVRKKDEAFFHIGSNGSWIEGECYCDDIRFKGKSVMEIADTALALTDKVGEAEGRTTEQLK